MEDWNSNQSGKKRKSTCLDLNKKEQQNQRRYRPKILDASKPEKKTERLDSKKKFPKQIQKQMEPCLAEHIPVLDPTIPSKPSIPEDEKMKYSCRRSLELELENYVKGEGVAANAEEARSDEGGGIGKVESIEVDTIKVTSIFRALESILGDNEEDFDSYMEKVIGERRNQNLHPSINFPDAFKKRRTRRLVVLLERYELFKGQKVYRKKRSEPRHRYKKKQGTNISAQLTKLCNDGQRETEQEISIPPDGGMLCDGGRRIVARKSIQDNFTPPKKKNSLLNESRLNRLIFDKCETGNAKIYGIDSLIHKFGSWHMPRYRKTKKKSEVKDWNITKPLKFKKIYKLSKFVPKVSLDVDSGHIWNMLMVNDTWGSKRLLGSDHEATKEEEEKAKDEEEKAKEWKEKNESFLERINALIACMKAIQGHRKYSAWKGSVIDSIVGVFLTQNVADNLSSMVYMEIASRYPIINRSKEVNSEKSILIDNVPVSLLQSSIVKEDFGSSNNGATSRLVYDGVRDGVIDFLSSTCDNDSVKVGNNGLDKSPCLNFGCTTNSELNYDQSSEKIEVKKPETNKGEEEMSGKRKVDEKKKRDWVKIGKKYSSKEPRHVDTMDSVDWNAVRLAPRDDIADIIKGRGQHHVLAKRIQDFLDDAFVNHNGDLEWLRNAPDPIAREYLLSHVGIGLKSVECVRLLALFKHAFPVDVNVGRIAVRLGLVPLQTLPMDIDFDLLTKYPEYDNIQRYLWPRLSMLSKETLYELHCHLITFGKVFCTMIKPNCKACPLKGGCRHYAIASARSKLNLPAPQQNKSCDSVVEYKEPSSNIKSGNFTVEYLESQPCDRVLDRDPMAQFSPIVEMPKSPERSQNLELSCNIREEKCEYGLDADIENMVQIPRTTVSIRETMARLLEPHNKSRWDSFKELVSTAVSNPKENLKKIVSRLKTTHKVYVLEDDHPLLKMFDKREINDPIPYLVATWKSSEVRKANNGNLVGSNKSNDSNTFGTILIPCRTAMRGRFPLNGTYFQDNEVFADDETSKSPIIISNEDLRHLKDRSHRSLYCGTSATSIYRRMSLEEIHHCFWEGFVCVKGFNRITRGAKPLHKILRGDSAPKNDSEEWLEYDE